MSVSWRAREPSVPARMIADHPVAGSLILGPLFATILALNVLAFTQIGPVAVACGWVFFALYGRFVAWLIRRNVSERIGHSAHR